MNQILVKYFDLSSYVIAIFILFDRYGDLYIYWK